MTRVDDLQRRPLSSRERGALVVVDLGIWALVVSTASRTLVAFGAPALVDFVHIPLVLCAAALAPGLIRASKTSRKSLFWLGVLLFITIVSWIGAGGELARPLAEWILLAEPLLLGVTLVAALLALPSPIRDAQRRRLELAVILVAVSQLLFGAVELARGGFGDHVQGTFLGLGSGAHVAGAVAAVGAIAVGARALRDREHRWKWLLLAIGLLLMLIATDAKQVIIAAIPAVLAMLLLSEIRVSGSSRSRRRARYVALGMTTLVFVALFSIYAPLRTSNHAYNVQQGSKGKLVAARLIGNEMTRRPEAFLVGLGPGDTVGKLATLTVGSGLRTNSPVAFLHLSQSQITNRVLALDKSTYVIASSSVWTGLSSALGLFGDLGILGVVAYVMAWWALLRGTTRRRSSGRAVALALVLFATILGIFHIWLEEPNFMLPLITLVAVSVTNPSSASEHARMGRGVPSSLTRIDA